VDAGLPGCSDGSPGCLLVRVGGTDFGPGRGVGYPRRVAHLGARRAPV